MNIPLDEWSGSKAIKQLERTVKRIEAANVWPKRLMLFLTAVAAVAAIIAAAPVVMGWLT